MFTFSLIVQVIIFSIDSVVAIYYVIDMNAFKGARIKEAREELGISQTQLASDIGITRVGLSKLESGATNNPSTETLAKLSGILEKPIAFFYTSYTHEFYEETPVTYRSFSSATKKENTYTDFILNRFALFLQFLYQYAYDRNVNLPDRGTNNPENLASDKEIEELAMSVRNLWGLPEGPVSNLIINLENNGIICLGYDLPETIDSVNVTMHFDGCRTKSHPIIVFNKNLNYFRQRFTIAHELGHIMLHSKWKTEEYKINHAIAEKQAHRFANAFMMPEYAFKKTMKRVKPTVNGALNLKSLWGMSIAAIGRRMMETDLLDYTKYRSFCIELSQRGWRKKEPLDADFTPEATYYLEHIFKAAFEKPCFTPLDVISYFGLYPEEIVKFIGNRDKFMAVPDDEIKLKGGEI